MPTKFYLHNRLNTVPGTLPSGEQAAATPGYTLTGALDDRLMDTGIGTAQASLTGSSAALATLQSGLLGMWVSPAMNAGTIGGGTINFSIAGAESNAASNFWPNSLNIYVWRPSNGTKVGTIRDSTGSSLGGTEVGTSQTTVYISGITSSAVTMQAGDVIVVEVWSSITQAMATAYTNTIYFDGTTENVTNGSASTNIAAFVEFTENVTFAPIVIDITGNSSSGSVGSITTLKAGDVDVTGNSGTGSVGTITTSIGNTLSGVSSTSTAGNVSRSQLVSISINGNSGTLSVGNTLPTLRVFSGTTTSTSSVGSILPSMLTGNILTSVSSSITTGILVPTINKSITSVISSFTVGNLSALTSLNILVSGTSSSTSVSSISRSSAISLSIAGNSTTVSIGNESVGSTINLSGVTTTFSVGDVADSTLGGIKFGYPTAVSATSILGELGVLAVTPPEYTESVLNFTIKNKYLSGTVISKWDVFNKTYVPYAEYTVSAKSFEYLLNRDILISASNTASVAMQTLEFTPALKSTEFVVPDLPYTRN